MVPDSAPSQGSGPGRTTRPADRREHGRRPAPSGNAAGALAFRRHATYIVVAYLAGASHP
jgi:hypothetical protein